MKRDPLELSSTGPLDIPGLHRTFRKYEEKKKRNRCLFSSCQILLLIYPQRGVLACFLTCFKKSGTPSHILMNSKRLFLADLFSCVPSSGLLNITESSNHCSIQHMHTVQRIPGKGSTVNKKKAVVAASQCLLGTKQKPQG